MTRTRQLFFWAAALLGAAQILAFDACGPAIRYPSCGTWKQRASDGAYCRECLDAQGAYAECQSAKELGTP